MYLMWRNMSAIGWRTRHGHSCADDLAAVDRGISASSTKDEEEEKEDYKPNPGPNKSRSLSGIVRIPGHAP